MASHIERRKFLATLGGAEAAWPLAAQAQQPAAPVVGFLSGVLPDGFTERLRGFRQGLKDTGHVEGENVTIEYRWAENQFDRLPVLAAELVRRRVEVIATEAPQTTRQPRRSPSSSPSTKTRSDLALSPVSPDSVATRRVSIF